MHTMGTKGLSQMAFSQKLLVMPEKITACDLSVGGEKDPHPLPSSGG